MKQFLLSTIFVLCTVFVCGAQTTPARIDVGKPGKRTISPNLMGFNTVYCDSPDALWATGKLQRAIQASSPGFLRWPGGTVCTFYHWDKLSGVGWEDSWLPGYSTPNAPAASFMDLDEYMAVVKATGATPLVGININSGFRFDRLQDGIDEALALMQYCRTKGYKVKYWYMGNEPYQHDCNGGENTIEQYAEKLNAFADRMRAFDPGIKLVANWRACFEREESNYMKLFELAGHNIDIIDIHNYWSWGDTSWEKWCSKTPIGVFTGPSYREEIATFRKLAARAGYPGTKLATLEWNVGPSRNAPESRLNPAQCALVQAEMMMQFMAGGMDYATFWPLFWKGEWGGRCFYDLNTGEVLPVGAIFEIMGEFGGGKLYECTGEVPEGVLYMVLRDKSGATRLCMLNKNAAQVDISFTGLKMRGMAGEQFALSPDLKTLVRGKPSLFAESSRDAGFRLAPYSISFITLK